MITPLLGVLMCLQDVCDSDKTIEQQALCLTQISKKIPLKKVIDFGGIYNLCARLQKLFSFIVKEKQTYKKPYKTNL